MPKKLSTHLFPQVYCRDPFMAAMFLPLFSVLFCMGVLMKQICWHSRRSEAHRGLPEARPSMQNVLWRSFMRLCFLSVFDPHFRCRFHWGRLFGVAFESCFYVGGVRCDLLLMLGHLIMDGFLATKNCFIMAPLFTIELGKSKCEKGSNTENWLYSLGRRF